MNTVIGVGLLVLGVVLLFFGFNASQSLGSNISEALTGSPSDKSIWLLGLGVVTAVVGLGLLFKRGAPHR